jgi:uncharacterized protein
MVQTSLGQLRQKLKQGLTALTLTGLLGYSAACLCLFFNQRGFIFNPRAELIDRPDARQYQLLYQTVSITIPNSQARLSGWWMPADVSAKQTTTAKTLLYLNGRGSNKSFHLPRMAGLHKLGLSILMFDYRGFGDSAGDFPHEAQVYADAQAAWNYLTQTRKIPPQQIILYGESLGGAIALDLAAKQPAAGGLILQSTFTSMAAVVRQTNWLHWFPIDQLLTERFDSLTKISTLRVPVLILHGQADPVVPAWMSQQLYNTAPQPKRLLLIPGKGHFSIYQPGNHSYLQAIQDFIENQVQAAGSKE